MAEALKLAPELSIREGTRSEGQSRGEALRVAGAQAVPHRSKLLKGNKIDCPWSDALQHWKARSSAHQSWSLRRKLSLRDKPSCNPDGMRHSERMPPRSLTSALDFATEQKKKLMRFVTKTVQSRKIHQNLDCLGLLDLILF